MAEVYIKGLNEAIRALRNAGDDMGDLKEANGELASTISSKASALAPRRTGALASTIRGNRAAKKVQIKAGNAAVPYAGPIEYGWQRRNIRPRAYLRTAAFKDRDYIKQTYENNIRKVINKYNLQ